MLSRWRELDLAEVVLHLRDGAPPWVFYEGPPTANGRPGLHHVWARVFKDLFPRFQTMRGHDVPRKGGWDCHGLPVEIEVEKELGFTNKSQIEAYGIDKFNARCRESVQRYVGDWEALTERAGVWIDTKDAYWTLSNDYVESVWWLLKQLYDKGPALRGPPGHPLLLPVRHGPVVARAGPAGGVPRRHRPVGVRALPGRRSRLRPAGVDDDAVDADLERGRRGGARHRVRAGGGRRRWRSGPGDGGGAGAGGGGRRRAVRGVGDGRAGGTGGRSTSCRSTTGASGWWAPPSCPPRTGRASSTWRPPSAPTTWRRPRPTTCPC